MISLRTNWLFVLSWLIGIHQTKGLGIYPTNISLAVLEGNKIGHKLLKFTLKPAKTGNMAKCELLRNSCKDFFKLEKENSFVCDNECTFFIVATNTLDRDFGDSCSSFTVKCNSEGKAAQREYYLYIEDINDNSPNFINRPYETSIPENFKVDTILPNLNIRAKDPDNGYNAVVSFTLIPAGQNSASINGTMVINQNGDIILKQTLDYETRNFYQYTVIATDGGNPPRNSTANIWIQVTDVQDEPPVFTTSLFNAHIKEHSTIGSSICTVSAEDGDRGIPNKIEYKIEDKTCQRFSIDSQSGVISVAKTLNLTDASLKNPCPITVIASEVTNSATDVSTKQNGTIFIDDINDNGPKFNFLVYKASVSEVATEDNPVSVDNSIQITDLDQQAENNKFRISLQKTNGLPFTALKVLPDGLIFRSAVVFLLVNDPKQLDYENQDFLQFQIVARGEKGIFKSSATVNLTILHFNEFQPKFQNNYTEHILENMTVGDQVTKVVATDEDKGDDGNITYRWSGSNGLFLIDSKTGIVTLGSKLDYEKVNSYNLSIEATDGNKIDKTYLHIYIEDINDERPKFISSKYEKTVKENEEIKYTVEAKDGDKPNTKNSDVRYEFVSVSQNLLKNFTIDKVTGEIKTTSIDYESLKIDWIVLEVMAFDQGDPQLNSTIKVNITIQDVNEFNPSFGEEIYDFSFPESAPSGFLIGNVSASDNDRGKVNKELTYLLDNGTDIFRINSKNGSIHLLGKLDRETQDQYTVQVKVFDSGSPQKSDTAILNISVTDVNDKSPKVGPSEIIKILENCTIGTSIGKINATDEDLDAKLFYSIYKQQIQVDGKGMFVNIPSKKKYFGINETTGDIYVNESLDREDAEIISLGIQVNDKNAVGTLQISLGQQKIQIEDINDNDPKFLQNITKRLIENHPVDTIITKVSATDADKDDKVTYHFQKNYSQFSINKTTGEIKLVKNLDREKNERIQLLVLAEDTKDERRTSTATIELIILDYNDNSPIFNDTLYNKTYYIKEDEKINSDILTVNATDADAGINADILYSLVYKGSDGKLPISINNTTGRIFVSGSLDREKFPSYDIGIEAKDMKGQYGARSGSIWIKLIVTDINDNAPIFILDSLKTPKEAENMPVGSSIMHVSANDKDDGENKRLSYTLEGNESTYFKIHPESGIISVNSSLEDQVGEKTFLVVATDHGTPSYNTSANVTVIITDVNNHEPIFKMQTEFIIPEDTCPGFNFVNVTAIDDDIEPQNKKVTYILKKEKDHEYFHLDEFNGILKLQKKLDSEKKIIYEIEIQAKDHGVPVRSSKILLRINATNVNDEPPVFLSKAKETPNHKFNIFYPGLKKTFPFPEGKPGRLMGKVDAYDSDPTSAPCYKIKDGTDKEYFKVIRTSGEIYSRKEIDYENNQKKTFHFQLKTEDCNKMNFTICDNTAVNIDDTLSISINITDANDNPPKFTVKFLFAAIQADSPIDTSIENLRLHITDDDEYLENKKNVFSIFNFKKHGEILMEKIPFLVRDGNLYSNQTFNIAEKGYIQFTILVTDSIGQNDTIDMQVHIVGKANKLKVIFSMSYEQTQKMKTGYCRKLSNILGRNITIVPERVESVKNKDGTFNKRQTAMYFYGLQNYQTIMLADELKRLIDFTKGVSSLQNDYLVSSVDSMEPRAAAASSSDSPRDKVILFAVIALLVVSLIAIIFLFYTSNQRFKRKLKAAQIDVHSNKPDMEKWIVPGSNAHAHSNPIYNKNISPAAALPDKVSLNSLDMNEVTDSAIFVDPYDEQEIALDFVEDQPNETIHGSEDLSKNFLDNVIREREAEMNKKNQNTGSMNGHTNMAFSTSDLETTDV